MARSENEIIMMTDFEVIYEFTQPTVMADLDSVLRIMQERGSSVFLNWSETTHLWECSWMRGGERFTGFSSGARTAVAQCLRYVLKAQIKNLGEKQ